MGIMSRSILKTNKLFIFDLDGVLIDSKDVHYEALNLALSRIGSEYVIDREEHLSKYDGISTTKKLKLLTESKGLCPSLYDFVWSEKQKSTIEIFKKLEKDTELIRIFSFLSDRDYKIAVASNSIRKTIVTVLSRLGIIEFVDYIVSNEDVKHTKPFPEMYWKCMISCNALPKDTIIIEDSHIGREAAIQSGANLVAIQNRKQLTMSFIEKNIPNDNKEADVHVPWISDTLNVLIPMAGAGQRFVDAGYSFPKPLIDINGKPMIQMVVESLNIKAHYIYVVNQEHYHKYNLLHFLNLLTPGCDIIKADCLTDGAARTTLLAKDLINNKNNLLIANSDQLISWNSNEVMYSFDNDEIDGGILVFKNSHPKWSYASLDENSFVKEVAEKKVISDLATVGIYFWKYGSDYVKYAEQMIAKEIKTNGEYYVCPVFNEAILDGKKIKVKMIEEMHGLGTPEDLNNYLLKCNGR